MRKFFLYLTMLGLALIASACQGMSTTPNTTSNAPTPSTLPMLQSGGGGGEATQTPAPALAGTISPLLLDQCNLLDSRDLAHLFSSAEVVLPQPQTTQVKHLIFSAEKIQASETSCTYYVFHRPGKANSEMLQISYWVDIPDQTTPTTWAQVWTNTSSTEALAIPGIGGGAFFANGRLTFKKGSTYLTVEAIGTNLNTGTRDGTDEQIQIEKQIAVDMLSRLG